MNKKAFVIMQSVAALAAVSGGLPAIGRPQSGRRRETIDDVLLRARARRDKAAFDPKLDGRVRGK